MKNARRWIGTVLVGFGAILFTTCFRLIADPAGEQSASSQDSLAGIAADIGAGTNTLANRELLGPSSRRTGWVISEIMYSPGTLAGGKNLEFVEIFNSEPTPEDIGGFRLSGSIDFTFPDRQIVPAGGFLVVAKSPEEVAERYHLSAVLGGWTRNLPRDKGLLRLLDRRKSVLLEIEYRAGYPWPMAADGGGHSIVLARPSYGENDPAAWAASSAVGGSPGADDPPIVSPLMCLKINEILANSGPAAEDFVELYNHGNQEVDISACVLTDDPVKLRFRFPPGTLLAPRGFISVKQKELGFGLKSYGEIVFLYNPGIQWAVDAVRFGGQSEGMSTGRCPDGADGFQALASPTPGHTNALPLLRDVVINEIHYHPMSEDDDDQFVELFNRGSLPVEVGGWRFTVGIDFTFPAGISIPSNGFLVVAKNAIQLRSHHSQLNAQNTVGDFSGRLSHGGDRIVLEMPQITLTTNAVQSIGTNTFYVVVNEVAYRTGGRWGQWADGGGSSLELLDARADNRRPSNWADSDEIAKAPWTTIEATGTLDLGVGSPDSLQLFLQGEGECLVDDVEVIAQNGTNLVANSTFETGTNGWIMQGTHERSHGETNGGFNSARSLHLLATGRGDTGANRIRTALNKPLPVVGKTATLRAKARWLRGNPGLLLRLHGNWLEASGQLAIPSNAGTPGAVNSRAVTHAGPAVFQVEHSPVLPAAQKDAIVTARVQDPDGVASVNLKYRVDPNGSEVSVPMLDDGTGGDAVAGDGLFSAAIPGQLAGVLVAFFVEAADSNSIAATARFPQDAPTRECLVRFGEVRLGGDYGVYRVWMTKKTATTWSQRMKLHNGPLDATFVYGDRRAIYNVASTYAGSPWVRPGYTGPTGSLCGYDFGFPDDDRLLGSKDMTMDYPVRDDTLQQEQIAYWIAEQMGLPGNRRRFVQLYVNGVKRGKLYEDAQRPNRELLDQYFAGNAGGDLFKLDDGFEFDSSASTFERDNGDTAATLENFTTTGGVKKTARYRWHWRKRAENGSVGDYSSLFKLVDAVNAPLDTYAEQVQSLVNIDEWMGVFALEHIVGNWDSYGYQRGKNMFAFKPANDKWQLLTWDIDFVMAAQGDSSESYFYAVDPAIRRMFMYAPFQRAYYQALAGALNGPLAAANIEPVLDAKYAVLKANGITASSPAAAKTFLKNRRTSLTNQLNGLKMDFAATSGSDFSTDRNWVVLNGVGPLDVKTVKVNGVEWPVTWSSVVSWSLRVPLNMATNNFSIQGYDRSGHALAAASTNLTIQYTGPFEQLQDFVAINEIMYRPTLPGAEFIELFNRSTHCAFDLSGCRISGIDFTFALGTLIEPGAYLVVAKDRATFWQVYGNKLSVAGEFAGRLNPAGEILQILQPSPIPGRGLVVDEVTYGGQFPWPVEAGIGGVSLQLLDPQADNWRVGNWTAVTSAQATNRLWQFASTTGVATNSRVLIYHSPLQKRPDPWDIAGYWDGAISFPGMEYAMTIEFTKGTSNQWTGTFQSGEITTPAPLNAVNYNQPSVYFDLGVAPNQAKWQGSLDTNGAIRGTFTQQATSYPFKLKRRADASGVWGGDVYVDDLSLVEGDRPGVGVNLIASGDFEVLASWQVSSNCAAVLDTDIKHSGLASLHLSASLGGDGQDAAIWQDAGTMAPGKTYTLSFWYYRGTNGNDLTVRTADSGLVSVRSLRPGKTATPGLHNSVSEIPPALPPLFLSEVEPNNVNGWIDRLGHRGSWLELVNCGSQSISLDGFYLSTGPSNRTQWPFPSGAAIGPGQYRIVWLDGQTGETTAQEWHANFSLAQMAGMVLLSQIDRGQTNMVDYLEFPALAPDHSYGPIAAGGSERQVFAAPTPGMSNDTGAPVPAVFINEWMASNTSILASPDATGFHDWFELYNAGAQPVDLSGYSLTDDPARRMASILPPGTQIGPGGFLIIVASGVDSTNGAGHLLCVDFKLDKEGDYIGLFTPNGRLVDDVEFRLQTANVSQGRWPDGHIGDAIAMAEPTPGMPNQKPFEPSMVKIIGCNLQPSAILTLTWTSDIGRFYQVQYKAALDDPHWQNVGSLILSEGTTATGSDHLFTSQTQRFYRVLLIE